MGSICHSVLLFSPSHPLLSLSLPAPICIYDSTAATRPTATTRSLHSSAVLFPFRSSRSLLHRSSSHPAPPDEGSGGARSRGRQHEKLGVFFPVPGHGACGGEATAIERRVMTSTWRGSAAQAQARSWRPAVRHEKLQQVGVFFLAPGHGACGHHRRPLPLPWRRQLELALKNLRYWGEGGLPHL
jgi:hypothetical protein